MLSSNGKFQGIATAVRGSLIANIYSSSVPHNYLTFAITLTTDIWHADKDMSLDKAQNAEESNRESIFFRAGEFFPVPLWIQGRIN